MMSGSFLFSHQKTKDGEHLGNQPGLFSTIFLYKLWAQEVLELHAIAALEILLENTPLRFSRPLERMLGGMVPMSDPAWLSLCSCLHFSSTKCPPRPPLPTSLKETRPPGSNGLIWRLPAWASSCRAAGTWRGVFLVEVVQPFSCNCLLGACLEAAYQAPLCCFPACFSNSRLLN